MKRLMLVLVFVGLFVADVGAQDSPKLTCTMDDLAPFMEEMGDLLFAFDVASSEGDVDALFGVIETLDVALGSAKALCNPLQFTGEGDKVLGPIDIQEGFYRVIFVGNPSAQYETELIAGECDFDGFVYLNQGETETETLFRADSDCVIVVAVADVEREWLLIYEQIA